MVFDCKPCGFEFNASKELKNHVDWDHNFECPQCEKTYPMNIQLREHTRYDHKNKSINKDLKNDIFQCSHCAKIFKGSKMLKQHIKMKHVEKVSPKECQKIQQHDATANVYLQCANCAKIFRNKESLKHHNKKGHMNNESSAAGKKRVFTIDYATKMYDYDEDELYDSSSDEDTGMHKEATIESESRDIRSLEEEEEHLNQLKLQLKILKAKKFSLKQGKIPDKNEKKYGEEGDKEEGDKEEGREELEGRGGKAKANESTHLSLFCFEPLSPFGTI